MVTLRFIKYFFFIAVLVIFLVSSVDSKEGDGCPLSPNILSKNYNGKREKYIVMLKSSENHFKVMTNCWNRRIETVFTNSDLTTLSQNENILRDFSVEGVITGYSGWFDESFVKEQLSKMDDVMIIEKDAPVKVNYVISQNLDKRAIAKNPPPNIDRIDQADFPLDGKFVYPDSAGKGVDIYVIDTGVRVNHSEFENRAKHGASFCSGCNDEDEIGHGTHVASIAVGKTLGVARKANLISVKVFNATGFGMVSDIIKGMSFVIQQHQTGKNKNSTVNMSFITPFSDSINATVEALTGAGIHVVVEAGNEAKTACESSPSSAKTAITVGATNINDDNIAKFTNIGNCIDIFAPGVSITGASNSSDTSTQVLSGTAQAAPHVSGTIALIISKEGNNSTAEITKKLFKLATKGVVKGIGKNTPNRFVRVPPP